MRFKVNTLEPGRVLKELVELERLLDLALWLDMQPDTLSPRRCTTSGRI